MNTEAEMGKLTTRPLTFSGSHLFVNADASRGELKVEVLDRDGHVIEPFTVMNCEPMKRSSTRAEIRWKGATGLSTVAKKQPVRLRFSLTRGELYAFWISPDAHGASQGYVAAGGPGFSGPKDMEGDRTAK
jgi:hypothetical protein